MRVLLCEDDDQLARGVTRALRRAGHAVTRAIDVADALEHAREALPDIALVDLSLPDGHGSRIVGRLRDRPEVGIIIVTAHGDEHSRVAGLRAGADDYVVKPFSVAELLARIDALGRRTRTQSVEDAAPAPVRITRGEAALDPESRILRAPDGTAHLTKRECELLALLMARSGPVPRAEFLDRFWPGASGTRSLDTHIAALRAKLPSSVAITTVHGVGYALESDPAAS